MKRRAMFCVVMGSSMLKNAWKLSLILPLFVWSSEEEEEAAAEEEEVEEDVRRR